MEEEILAAIDKKLDAILRLLASRIVEGKNKTEAILVLDKIGLEPSLIAEIMDTTSSTVHARLSEARKKTSKRQKPAQKAGSNE